MAVQIQKRNYITFFVKNTVWLKLDQKKSSYANHGLPRTVCSAHSFLGQPKVC